jgi:hypothetical protein
MSITDAAVIHPPATKNKTATWQTAQPFVPSVRKKPFAQEHKARTQSSQRRNRLSELFYEAGNRELGPQNCNTADRALPATYSLSESRAKIIIMEYSRKCLPFPVDDK